MALLGCLMTMALPQVPTPRVLGVDDFSLRRVILRIFVDHGRGLGGRVEDAVFDAAVSVLVRVVDRV